MTQRLALSRTLFAILNSLVVWSGIAPVTVWSAEIGDAEAAAANVPVKRVVLFNSGVGFFQHDAEVEGTRKVELKFNVSDINDLLKSLVVQDRGGGLRA